MKIELQDYVYSDVHHLLDTETGASTIKQVLNRDKDQDKVSGFAAVPKIDLWKRKKVLVALFFNQGSQVMWIEKRAFDFTKNPNLSCQRKKVGPFRWKFIVKENDEIVEQVKYWFLQYQEWPDNGDIFSYCEEQTRDPLKRESFSKYWAKKSGMASAN